MGTGQTGEAGPRLAAHFLRQAGLIQQCCASCYESIVGPLRHDVAVLAIDHAHRSAWHDRADDWQASRQAIDHRIGQALVPAWYEKEVGGLHVGGCTIGHEEDEPIEDALLGRDFVEHGPRLVGADEHAGHTFAKIKHWMHLAQMRSIEEIWHRLGDFLDTVTPEECANCFANAGYASVKT